MSIKKRSSIPLAKAKNRSSAIRGIDATYKLSATLTAIAYELKVKLKELDYALTSHNDFLGLVDESANQLDSLEKDMVMNSRFLAGIAASYGRDSNEYEKAGGTRTQDRKRAARKGIKPTM